MLNEAGTHEQNCLITTLMTSHGFEVCFAIPFEACRSLGWNLQHHVDEAVETNQIAKEAIASGRGKFN